MYRRQAVERDAKADRIETGSVQFGSDWPGFFIRGDDAIAFGRTIETLAARLGTPELAESDPGAFLELVHLSRLAVRMQRAVSVTKSRKRSA